jgi:hypothetical protein
LGEVGKSRYGFGASGFFLAQSPNPRIPESHNDASSGRRLVCAKLENPTSFGHIELILEMWTTEA